MSISDRLLYSSQLDPRILRKQIDQQGQEPKVDKNNDMKAGLFQYKLPAKKQVTIIIIRFLINVNIFKTYFIFLIVNLHIPE